VIDRGNSIEMLVVDLWRMLRDAHQYRQVDSGMKNTGHRTIRVSPTSFRILSYLISRGAKLVLLQKYFFFCGKQ